MSSPARRTPGGASGRRVAATHARRRLAPDPPHERSLAQHLRRDYPREELLQLYERHREGATRFDALMRRVVLRALCRRMGRAVEVSPGVRVRHPETFEIGDGVFLGTDLLLWGRHDGRCRIGARAWIGPASFLDARDLVVGEAAGLGPGVRILGSQHTGEPLSEPVIATELVIRPVRLGPGCDVGTGSVILPGVHVGAGAIVGAGAVVDRDVPARSVVAGVPARLLRRRGRQEASR